MSASRYGSSDGRQEGLYNQSKVQPSVEDLLASPVVLPEDIFDAM